MTRGPGSVRDREYPPGYDFTTGWAMGVLGCDIAADAPEASHVGWLRGTIAAERRAGVRSAATDPHERRAPATPPPRTEMCDDCRGTGLKSDGDSAWFCRVCGGAGVVGVRP